MSSENLESIAADALDSIGAMRSVPADVIEIAKGLGLEVEHTTSDALLERLLSLGETMSLAEVKSKVGAVLVRAGVLGPKPTILVPRYHMEWSQRFDIAHEIGHFLDRDDSESRSETAGLLTHKFKTTGNDYVAWRDRRKERRADEIARSLLMPAGSFLQDASSANAFGLASKYKVPTSEAVDRMLSLNACPMARLTCRYRGRTTRRLFNTRHPFISVQTTDSITPSLLRAVLAATHAKTRLPRQGDGDNMALTNEHEAPSRRGSEPGVIADSDEQDELILAPFLAEWLSTNKLSSATVDMGGKVIELAVYNDFKNCQLVILMAEAEAVREARLENGLFAPVRRLPRP